MIRIEGDGEIIINGQKVSDMVKNITSSTKSSNVVRKVVVRNGEVIENTTVENGEIVDNEDFDDFQDFHSRIMNQINDHFEDEKQETTIVECEYCRSKFKSSEENCPNCGANNNQLTV